MKSYDIICSAMIFFTLFLSFFPHVQAQEILMKILSLLQNNLECVFDNGIYEGTVHQSIRRAVISQAGYHCTESTVYHYCEERDLPKRHLLLLIYVHFPVYY